MKSDERVITRARQVFPRVKVYNRFVIVLGRNPRWRRSINIRKRLLILAIGGVVPLLLVGLALLWSVWHAKQQQLNDGIAQQAELAAVLFDRWLDAQEQPLRTVAEYSNQSKTDPSQLQEALEAAIAPRSPPAG